ncbi:methyl-accepting chemotaxis protein, partial [Stigmatella aurantiaca]
MSIGKKIGAGFGLALLVLLIVSGMSLYGTGILTDTTEELVRSELTIEQLRQLTAHLVDAEAYQRNYIITGKEEFLNAYRASVTESRATLQRLNEATASSESRTRQAANLPSLIEARLSYLEDSVELLRTKDRETALANVQRGTGNSQMNQIRRITREMLEQEHALWTQSHEDASNASRLILVVVSLGAAVGVLLVLGVSLVLTRGITGPLERLMSGVEHFTRGNLAHRIEVHNEDETGKLARAFNAMAERRQESEAQVARQSEQREQTLRTVAEFVNQLAGASSEILSSTSEQVASAQEQGSAVAETVSTVEEIAQTSDEAAGRARAVSESARQSEELGKGGRQAVNEAVSAMATVREQVESIASRILALAEQAQAIGDI